MEIPHRVTDYIRRALDEDIGHGDTTSSLLIPSEDESRALYIAKGNFILAGLPFIKEVFRILNPAITFSVFSHEGSQVKKGIFIAEVNGNTRSLLAGERVSLNILQRLSGIATLTKRYVDKVRGLTIKIVDTRKTTPCLRYMEKYAVRMGGGANHRFGLYDGILIKDNHIEAVGSIRESIKRAKRGHHLSKIEVEVKDLSALKEAISAGADLIMLDNMSIPDIKKAVRLADKKVLLEASGNIRLTNVRDVAETGIDFISVGAITHSAVAADISLKIVE